LSQRVKWNFLSNFLLKIISLFRFFSVYNLRGCLVI
jgi:hypothetical protein